MTERDHQADGQVGAERLALVVLAFTVVGPLLGAAALVATSDAWLPPLRAMSTLEAATSLFVATVVLVGMSVMPTHAASLVAGMRFGAVAGPVVAILGVTAAAWLGYAVLRRLLHARTVSALSRRPRARRVVDELLRREGRLVTAIFLVRLSPVMPFAATNLLLSACGAGLRPFLVGSAVGLLPRVTIVAVAGAGLAELDLDQTSDVRVAAVGVVATVALLWLLGRIARRSLAVDVPPTSD